MTTSEARAILEAMADGCNPHTGEVLPVEHILMDESVMEALLIAVEALQGKKPIVTNVHLPDEDLFFAVEVFRALQINATAHRVAGFITGEAKFKEADLMKHALFGRHQNFKKAQVIPWLEEWMLKHNIHQPKVREDGTAILYPFFDAPHHNKLSPAAAQQLGDKVLGLPMQRTENLSEYVIEKRKTFPRSNEPWPEEELRLLTIALQFTNDVAFLSQAFGRSELAISAQSEKILANS